MERSTDDSDGCTARDRSEANAATTRSTVSLDAVVVRYENGPDRCTVVPRDVPEERTVTTWLSADLDGFVDLLDAR